MNRKMTAAAAAALAFHAPARADNVQVNGIELHYDVRGSGEPLILLHGFGMCAADWTTTALELAKHYRVITFDARGHGRSTNPANKFSHRQAAEDVRALMDRLNIAQARAIGFSSGGMTLLHLSTRYPDRLSKMVVVGATYEFQDHARSMLRGVAKEGLPPPVLAGFRKCAKRGDAQVNELVAQFTAFAASTDDMNLTTAELAKVKASTLIVHGDRDEFFPVSIPVAMYGAIPKSELWIVPGGDHSPSAGADEEEFVEVVGGFLKK
jgi:pimeloyl-ACP methyl ester carboxylesterase